MLPAAASAARPAIIAAAATLVVMLTLALTMSVIKIQDVTAAKAVPRC